MSNPEDKLQANGDIANQKAVSLYSPKKDVKSRKKKSKKPATEQELQTYDQLLFDLCANFECTLLTKWNVGWLYEGTITSNHPRYVFVKSCSQHARGRCDWVKDSSSIVQFLNSLCSILEMPQFEAETWDESGSESEDNNDSEESDDEDTSVKLVIAVLQKVLGIGLENNNLNTKNKPNNLITSYFSGLQKHLKTTAV